MTFTYQLTAADYREAFLHHQRSATRRRLIARSTNAFAKFIPGIVVAIGYLALQSAIPSLQSPERAASRLANLADTFLPLLSIFLIYIPIVTLGTINLRTPNWRALLANLGMSLLMVLFCAMLYFGTRFRTFPAGGPPASEPLGPILAPHLAWFLVVALAAYLTARTHHLNGRLAWIGQQHLHLPFTVEATADVLTLTTPNSASSYAWRAIPLFTETPRLFVLHISDLAFHIVPKRAFATAEEQTAFRHMLQTLAHAPPNAFPVVTGASPA